ncbi:MAG: T9SS type A sorting domain-containing protein, partial [Candidatus Cloacimonetes bacterium]|nr:T9SS type A sorting domain-containing protein [Candidatus Cloacimonadota bacterium]
SSYGSISGTVTLADGVGNITDVEVTAGGMTSNPETNGDYSITIAPGTYDVTASLAGYIDSTITGVDVLSGDATTDIDFILNPEGELSLLLPTDAEGCPGSSVSIPLTLDNPEEIEIEGIDVVITFNEGIIDATEATLTGGVLEYEDYGFFANTDVDGEITLEFYALSDLFSGSGIIAFLEFDVVGSEGDFTDLIFSFAQVNEASVTVNDGYFTVIPCDFDIEGNIGYYSNASPIANTELELTGDGTYSTTTTTSGDYIFNDIPGGNYVSTPSKADDLGGLSGTDASRIARYVALLYEFDCLEIIAADVSMNGHISGTDASRVARYVALLITELNGDGIDWVFTPEPIPNCNDWPPIIYENTREYTPLESDLIDEDFIGIRLGDVSGNWAPDVRMPLTQKSSPPGADPSEEATEIEASNNSTLRIPVVIDEVNAIEGIDIIIAFSPEVLKLTGLSLNEGILEDNNYGVETNLEEVGQGIMVIYAQKDLVSETGIVAFIEFDIIGIEGSKSEIYFTKFDVNETDASGGFNLIDSESNEIITRRLEVNVVQPLPDKFALYPNYPNPFRNHTTISYALPEATNVKIQIYNIRGQLVTELVNGFETAGRKKIVWNTEGYANGIYFCNISTEKNNEKIKLLLLR